MKRILAILCAMACLFALAVPALAAPDTITVTAQVPADWEELYIHFWGGAEASTWPGVAMTPDNGRFTFEIPGDSTGLLVHNNQGRQCQDLAPTGDGAVWIVYDGSDKSGATLTPTDPGMQELGSTTPPTQDTPAPVLPDGEKVTVYAYVPDDVSPRLWAWQDAATDINAFQSWPGEAFAKEGDWWVKEMPAACNAIIVNNGSDKQTGDTTVEAGKDVWAVVQYDWTVEIFYTEPNLKEVVKEAPSIDENPLFSRPTLGETQPKVTYDEDDEPTNATETSASSTKKDAEKTEDEGGLSKKTQAIIVIATAVVAIVAIAFVLSIPKKLK